MPVTKKTPQAKSSSWTWPNKAKVALSVVVNVEEGSEYSLGDGDKITEPLDELGVSLKKPIRNYGNESNYRYGILEGHARVAALLDKYKVAATYTAAAVALERAPDIADYIKARKHETCCHGYRWVHQFSFDEAREREFIKNGLDSIEKSTGLRPQGWLSRYLHTENTRRLLQEAGCLYHMDDYSRDTPFWGDVAGSKKKMIILPYQLDTNDMKMWLAPGYLPSHWLEYAVDTLDQMHKEASGKKRTTPIMMSFGLHLRIIGRPGRIGYLEKFLKYAAQKSGVWFARRVDIAKHFQANVRA
ncbi:MAG: polysaccharide deacetylase family protein [Burkholderiales bacterium]|jgi:allantoinase|nr:polysaccharide deacetylase family protein [Betaproteobacteria bacterium]